jgi:radical SAM superfamily enzyme YgiQ (UPF0313 family)
MANVLLVFPNPKTIHPRYPNALLPLAAALLANGHKVKVFDEQFENYADIALGDYDCVGISTLTGQQITNALKIAESIRKKSVSMPLIWGGIHPSLMPEQTARNRFVDIVVRGEGEETLLELIERLEAGKPIDGTKGITFERDGEIYSTADREFINLDELPFLPYGLLTFFYKYSNVKRKIIYLQTSRGCPHSCGFCYVNFVHKRTWRSMSPQRVVDEMTYIKDNFNPDLISLVDDEFFISKRRVSEICQKIVHSGLGIRWSASGRYDQASKYDRDFLELLEGSGCEGVSFGGESGSPMILKFVNKRITVEQMKSTVRNFRDTRMYSTVNFMAGFPGEADNDVAKTFDMIDELTAIYPGLRVNSISVYTPFPNTPLYNEALNNGFKEPQSLREWGDYSYNDVNNLPWLDKSMKGLLRTISLLTECEFNRKGQFKSVGLFEDSWLKRTAYTILSFSAKFRWRHKFFRFPVEWRLLDLYFRLRKMGER